MKAGQLIGEKLRFMSNRRLMSILSFCRARTEGEGSSSASLVFFAPAIQIAESSIAA
jgi:hypothetical protein